MIRSRLELTFSVIRTTLPRAFCLRSRKNVLRSAMIFSVQIISSSTAVIFLRLNEAFRIELPTRRVNDLFTPKADEALRKKLEKYRHFFHPGFRIHYPERPAENRSNSTNASNLIDLKKRMGYRRSMGQHKKEGSRRPGLFMKIISFDLFFQGNKYGMSKGIASYLLFTYLFFGSVFMLFPRTLRLDENFLLISSLSVLILMICFFNCFLVYKKSQVLFFMLYILPLMGIVMSMSLTALSHQSWPKNILDAGQPRKRKLFEPSASEQGTLLPPMGSNKEKDALKRGETEKPLSTFSPLPVAYSKGVDTFTPEQAAETVFSINPEWTGQVTSSQPEVYTEAAQPPALCMETRRDLKAHERPPYVHQWNITCKRDGKTRTLSLFCKKDRKKWYMDIRGKMVPCILTRSTVEQGNSNTIVFLDALINWFHECEDGRPLLFISYQNRSWYADLYFSIKDGKLLYHGPEYVSATMAASM